jgi:hypothetical protein
MSLPAITLIVLACLLAVVVIYAVFAWISKDPYERNPESHS